MKKNSDYRKAGLVFEELEPRLLLSAEPLAVATDASVAIVQELVLGENEDYTAIVQSSVDQVFSSARNELVIIDSRAPNYQQLYNDLIKQQQEGRKVHVVVLDAHRDGIEQINEALASYNRLDAVHIVSHGDDAQVQLGANQLNKATLRDRSSDIAQWRQSFTDGGDLLIYGCDLASTSEGRSMVHALGYLTATDVAASDDPTGNSILGGDWDLEYEAGDIETGVAFSEDVQQNWHGTLESAAPAEAGQEQTDTEEQQQAQADLIEQQTTRTQEDRKTESEREEVQAEQAAIEQGQRLEIVFIDESVTDFQDFVDDLQDRADGVTTFEVYTLDGRSDGVEYIEAVLAGYNNVDAVHIYSHGDDAAVKLGSTWLNPNNLEAYNNGLKSWSKGLDVDADILIYGCNLAQTDEGKQFASSLALLTGADVAASDDYTGHSSLDADWELEYRTGSIESRISVSTELQNSWKHVMTVSVDASSSGSTADQASVTVSHTTSGTNRLMLVGVSMEPNAESVSSITYNGVNMTLIGIESNEPNKKSRVEIWGLVAPELGTHDVIVNLTSNAHNGVAVGVMTFTEVSQLDPWLNFTGDSGKSTNPATMINSAAGDLVFGVVAVEKGTTVSPGTGQTEHWDTSVNTINGGGSVESGAGTVTTSWTSNNQDWSVAAVSIQSMNNLATTTSLTAVQDATIKQEFPATNSGTAVNLIVNRESGKEQRTLLQFDLGSIPPGATIQNATLKLDSVYHGGQLSLDVYQLLESWSEGSVTWNERSSGTNWTTAGGEFNATVLDTVVANAEGEHDWNITGLVQYWLDGTAQNYGVMIDTPDNGGNREIDFDSRDGTVAPVLEISYVVNSAPVITSNGGGAAAAINVAENTAAVTTVTATDVDLDTVTYSISGGADAALFNIDSNSGVLTFISAPNFETPADANADNVYEVTVQASDGVDSDTQAISVAVTDVLELAVTNTNPTGTGSLHEAILNANANTGVTDTITFNIPGAGPHVINLAAALPTITDSLIIDGTTEPDYAGTPVIVLDGTSAGSVNGITLSADNSTIRGLVINNFAQNGILINGNDNTIAGNYIGVDATGILDCGNGQDGVQINGDNNIIGGSVPADRNVFSGNGDEGIDINAGATGTIIQGNYVGTNAAGTAAIPNGAGGIGNWGGILVGGENTTVGGSNPGEGNLISGNNSWGIVVESNNNVVQGNLIGTQADGTSALGNTGHGIRIGDYAGGSNNLIGGTMAGTGNVIANNGLDGVAVTGSASATILGNTILNNSRTGIDLGDDGVTANDAGDVDIGANTLQNFPVIATAELVGTDLTLSGTLMTDGLNIQYRIEFFGNLAGSQDATNGEGSVYLGSILVTTDGSGNAAFSGVTLGGVTLSAGDYVTATATHVVNAAQIGVDDLAAYGATSEYATNFLINNLPVAVNDSYSTNEDTPFTATLAVDDLLLNDSDLDGDTLTVNTTPVVDVNNGSLVLNADGTFTYTPNANFNGSDTFTYEISDGNGGTDQATVTITVTAAPDLVDDAYTVVEDSGLTNFTVLGNDDTGAGLGTITGVSAGSLGGTIAIAADNVSIDYTPAAGVSGTETFTYTFTDLDGNVDTATVAVTVTAAPDLVDDTVSTAEDTAVVVPDVLANDDLGVGGGSITAFDAASANGGTVVAGPGNTFTYTPAANFVGADTFTYTYTDADGNVDTATVTITVTAAPDLVDDAYTVVEDSGLTNFTVLGNDDTGAGLGTITAVDATGTSGTVAINADNVTIDYTPSANYVGVDTFTYTFTDLDGNVDTATVTVTVTAAPDLVDDAISTVEDTAVVVPDVLANDDLGVGGGSITAFDAASANGGTVVAGAGNTFTYTPATNFFGVDSFTYTYTDTDGNADTATVTITVTAVNDSAVIGGVDTGSVTEDVDPDGDTLLETSGTLTIIDPDPGEANFLDPSPGVYGGLYGVITLKAAGDWNYAANTNQPAIQNLAAGATIVDTITVSSVDGTTHDINITITGTNDVPVAGNDVAVVNEGGSVLINLAVNDTDIDDSIDLNSVTITGLPANGTLTNNFDGTVTYTHDGSETLVDSFTYTISDISGAVSNSATVTVSINPINDPPIAVDDTVTVAEGNSILVDLATNDSDVDNALDLNSISIIAAPANGTLVVNGDGTVTYNHDGSETSSDTFTYTISDISGVISNTATVNITVTPVNDAPTTVGIAGVTVNEDAATTTIDLNAAFNDADNLDSELTYSIAGNTNIGLFSLAGIDGATGQLSLGYAADMNGAAQITIRAADPSGSSVNTIFTVTVTPVNDAPVIQANNGIVATGVVPDIIASSNLSVNDVDNSNSEITYILTVMPGNGALLLNGVVMTVNDTFTQADLDNNRLVYQAAGTVQADQFGFTVTDGAGGTLANNTFDISIQLAQDNSDDTDTEAITPSDDPEEEPTQEIIGETGGAADEEDAYGRGYELFGSTSTPKPQPRPVLSIEPTAVPGKKPSQPVAKDATELKTSEIQSFTVVQMKSMDAMWSAIDKMKQEMGGSSGDKMSSAEFRVAAAKSSGLVLTAGVVAWILRSGALLSSLLSTIPLWKGYDPLPILAYKDDDENDEDEIHEDKIPTSLEELKKLKKLKQKKPNEVDVDSLFGGSTIRE